MRHSHKLIPSGAVCSVSCSQALRRFLCSTQPHSGAQQKPAAQSTNQSTRPIKHTPTDLKANSETIKSDTQIKGDRTIKMDSQIKSNTATKNATWTKGGVTASDASQIKGDSSQIKAGATIKSTAPIKSSTGAMKTDNAHIKSSSTPQQ